MRLAIVWTKNGIVNGTDMSDSALANSAHFLRCLILSKLSINCSSTGYIDGPSSRMLSLISREYDYVVVYVHFLDDLPRISPWIKSIFNELDIIIHVIASQLSGHCDVINNRLWRHQQNENWASDTRGRCVNIVVFIVIYGFVMPCKKLNNVCNLMTNCFRAHASVIFRWNLRNKLQRNFNRNWNIFIQENAFESVVCEMAAILYRPQCVKWM